MRVRKYGHLDCGEELRTGSAGVPLAVADRLFDLSVRGHRGLVQTATELGLSKGVAIRMAMLLRRHGVPSKERRILLSLGYPERSKADVAAAFGVSVDYVEWCEERAKELRRSEPLSTELWEDITEDEMSPDEIRARAQTVRRRNELVQAGLSEGPFRGPQGREALGREMSDCRGRRRSRQEAGPARPQPPD